jgi:hypothetical protein
MSGGGKILQKRQDLSRGRAGPRSATIFASHEAPFVGCYAAAVVVAELLRRRVGEAGHDVIDLSLRNPALVEVA